MRAVVAVIVVAAVGFGLYVHQENSGKMSAASLQTLLYKDSLTWAPFHPVHVTCQSDPQRTWDYICTDAYLGEVWGYKVNGAQVTGSALLSHN